METREYEILSRLEDRYWWHVNLRRLALSMLRQHAQTGPGSKLLDLGCGTGGTLAFLRGQLDDSFLYGADRHPLAVALARTRFEGALTRASADALPFRDSVFDALLSLDVFYVHEVDEGKAFLEAHRVLKDHGILLVNLPAFDFLRGRHDVAVHTRHRYTSRELGRKLRSAGFSILRLTYWNAFLFPVVLARRQLQRLQDPSGPPRSDLAPLPCVVNEFLKILLGMERIVLSRVNLPFGSSVFAVARKLK